MCRYALSQSLSPLLVLGSITWVVVFTEDECVVDVGIYHVEVVFLGNFFVLRKVVKENLELLRVQTLSAILFKTI